MNTQHRNAEDTAALSTAVGLLEDLRLHIHKHGEALIRMNLNDIERHLAAERSSCEQLAAICSQLGPIPADVSDVALELRRAFRTHSILLAKSRVTSVALANTYSVCCGYQPSTELLTGKYHS